MHQDPTDAINGDSNGHLSGLSQDTSLHPQMSAFTPDPILPPGVGDLVALERLKDAIKNNQHEVFRAVPQPAVLASLWQGPASLSSDSDGPRIEQIEQNSEERSLDLAGEKFAPSNGSVSALASPSKLDLVTSRAESRDKSVMSVANGASEHEVETSHKVSVDPPNGHASHTDLTPVEAIQDVKPDTSVEPLTPLTPTSLPSTQDHHLEHDRPEESHDDVALLEHGNGSQDGSAHEDHREKTADALPSPPPSGSLDSQPEELEHVREPDRAEPASNGQPSEEIRNIYERPPELARRLDLESRIEPRPRNMRYEPRSESYSQARVEHARSGSGNGREFDRLPRSPHAIDNRSPLPRPRLEDRITDGSRSGPHGAPASTDSRRFIAERASNVTSRPPVIAGPSATERRPYLENRRFDESRPSEIGRPVGEARHISDIDRRASIERRSSLNERRPVFEERRGPPSAAVERRLSVDPRPTNSKHTAVPENRFDDDARRHSFVERTSYDERRPATRPAENRQAPMLEERRPFVDDRRRAASPDPISVARSLSSPSKFAFPRSQSVAPTTVSAMHRPSSPRPISPSPERSGTSIARAPSLQERIGDAPPVSTRSEETGRTLPPRMAGSVHALEARNRTISHPSTRPIEDIRLQRLDEPARERPPHDILPPAPERPSYPSQARPASPIDRDDRRLAQLSDSRERRPPPPQERPHTMSYTRPVSPPSRQPPALMPRPRTPVIAHRPPPPASDYRRDSRIDFRPKTPELRPRSPERRPANYERPIPIPDRRINAPLSEPRSGPPPPAPYRRYDPPAPSRPLSPPPRERYPAEPPRREPERAPIRADYNGRPAYDVRAPPEVRPPPPVRKYDGPGRFAPVHHAPNREREPYRATPAPVPIRDDRRMDIARDHPRDVDRVPPQRDAFYPPGPSLAAHPRSAPYLPPTPTSATYPPYTESRTRARSRSPVDDRRPPLKRPRDDAYDYERETRSRDFYPAQGPPPSASVYTRDTRRTPPPTAVPYRR